jgi:hypothetical protein
MVSSHIKKRLEALERSILPTKPVLVLAWTRPLALRIEKALADANIKGVWVVHLPVDGEKAERFEAEIREDELMSRWLDQLLQGVLPDYSERYYSRSDLN